MLGLSANLNYYLFNGNVDLRKGIFRLCESIREEMSLDPSDASNVYMFMSRNRKVVKKLHYERGFYVLYEKRPVMGKFKKPVFTLWLTRLPNLSELKHRKARLIGESIYGLFFAKHVKLVYYHHYNNGSRASDVAKTFLERIHHKVVMMMQDTKLMANELMRKGCELYDKPVEIPEKYPQGRFCGNIEQPL